MGVIKGFVGPAYQSVSRAINAQRCINLRLEIDQANGRSPLALIGLPGYTTPVNVFGAGPIRGAYVTSSGQLFVMSGTDLLRVNADSSSIVVATLAAGTTPVVMADNGIHLMAVDGVGVVAIQLSNNAATYTIANFPYGARSIVCIDNTFIAEEPNSQRFYVSTVGNALVWNATDSASAEAIPDNITRLIGFSRQLFVFGTASFQAFVNSGDDDRPFIPQEGTLREVGCQAPYSVAKDEGGVYMVGQDSRGGPRVYKFSPEGMGVVSDTALDHELEGYTIANASGYTFRMDGHVYYVVTFPTDDRTWVYDATTQAWSEFLEWDEVSWHRHRSSCAIFAYGRQFIGDYQNGNWYELRSDIYRNGSGFQRALRTSAHVNDGNAPVVIGNLDVLVEPGVSPSGDSPEDLLMEGHLMLRTSRDGGKTFGPVMSRGMGRLGEYRKRVKFNRPCGAGRDIVFEVSITDNVKRVILEAFVNGI